MDQETKEIVGLGFVIGLAIVVGIGIVVGLIVLVIGFAIIRISATRCRRSGRRD